MILVVVDNARNMKLVHDVLHANGFETLEATSADAGIELALARRPHSC